MSILSAFLTVRKLSPATQQEIKEIQLQRLQELVDYARQHSSYFKTHYQQIPQKISDISQLPATTKPELMENFDNWVTDPTVKYTEIKNFISKTETIGDMYLNKYYVCTTSGSTGEPAIIIHDQHSRHVYTAIGLLRALLPRISLIDMLTKFKTAAILATGGHFLGYATLMNRVKKVKLRQKTQKVFSVFTPIPELVENLNAFQPNVLGGYPTVIYLLAKEQLEHKLNIHPFVITSAGENLQPYMRKTMEQAFNCEILNGYGASEVPGLTTECKYHNLHVNTDWHFLEQTDNNSILVTNLSNFVQPIIRYKMGDNVSFKSEQCACGSNFPIITVSGRDDEILQFTAISGEKINILPLAISTVAEETPGVYQCQIIQTTAQQISVRVKVVEGEGEEVKNAVKVNLQNFLTKQNLTNVDVEISQDPPQTNPKSGKFRSVIRNSL
jgi:phenylacetate-CoA ligase